MSEKLDKNKKNESENIISLIFGGSDDILKAKSHAHKLYEKLQDIECPSQLSNEKKKKDIYKDMCVNIIKTDLEKQIHMLDIACIIDLDNDEIDGLLALSSIKRNILLLEMNSDEFELVKKTIKTLTPKTSLCILNTIINIPNYQSHAKWQEKYYHMIENMYDSFDECDNSYGNLNLSIILSADNNDAMKIKTLSKIVPNSISFMANNLVDDFNTKIDSNKSDVLNKTIAQIVHRSIVEVNIVSGYHLFEYMSDNNKKKFIDLAIENSEEYKDGKIKSWRDKIIDLKTKMDRDYFHDKIGFDKKTKPTKRKIL